MSGLEEIKAIFEEECREGLDAMESGLLAMETADQPLEFVNDIFRAAHSIKGGAATFGYSEISQFTHQMETLLDLVRSNKKSITPSLVQLLLQCVDCLRDMMETMHGGDYDRERADQLRNELSAELADDEVERSAGRQTTEDAADARREIETGAATSRQWRISFRPARHLMKTGNQPLALFHALAELGDLSVRCDVAELPAFDALDPEQIYLAWEIDLCGDTERASIAEVFEWVDSDCELDIVERAMPRISEEQALELHADVTAKPEPGKEGVQADLPQEGLPRDDRRQGERRQGDRRQSERRSGSRDAGSIRVGIDKVDTLVNLVGEMVITQAMLSRHARESGDDGLHGLIDRLVQLERNTRELQEAVMQIRMLPVNVTFSRLPRLVHDLSRNLGKSVDLTISGEQTELDKTVLEKIGDPLIHLIRNSLDHGIESTEERIAAGKNPTGSIHLGASHEGGNIVIRVTDDGAGLDTERILAKGRERAIVGPTDVLTEAQVHELIFAPGFSTADVVSDVSGRGVGMDVVRNNIKDIGGRVEVFSERGRGCTFQITLPLTLAILEGQMVRVGREVYVVPLLSIKETVQIEASKLNVVAGGSPVYRLRGQAIPVVDMRRVCRVPGCEPVVHYEGKLLMFVEIGRHSIGLLVDELLEQSQVVIKSLEANFTKIEGVSGATILGDGTVAMIVDVAGILRLSRARENELEAGKGSAKQRLPGEVKEEA